MIESKRPHTPLDRERVLQSALDLVNDRGLDGLTMRAIAAELGVEAPSLYKHIQGKDDILDGLCELVYLQVSFDEHPEDWRDRLRTYSRAFRNALLSNRAVVPLIATRPVTTERSILVVEAALSQFAALGFQPESARRLLNVTVAMVIGQVLADIGSAPLADLDGPGRPLGDKLDDADIPLVRATLLGTPADRDAEFELSLDLLIAGIEQRFGPELDLGPGLGGNEAAR